MMRRLDHAVSWTKGWCQRQAEREAPFMPATALGAAFVSPLFTAIQDQLDRTPKDSSWPFCLFLTGLFLHLAVGWGFEYKSRWKYNRAIGQAALWCCLPFWALVAVYMGW